MRLSSTRTTFSAADAKSVDLCNPGSYDPVLTAAVHCPEAKCQRSATRSARAFATG